MLLLLFVQTLFLIFFSLSTLILDGFVFAIIAVIIGLVPLIYMKKFDKKVVLNINLFSSFISLLVVLIVYFLLKEFASTFIGERNHFMLLFNVTSFLQESLLGLLLFNVPSLVSLFFKKK